MWILSEYLLTAYMTLHTLQLQPIELPKLPHAHCIDHARQTPEHCLTRRLCVYAHDTKLLDDERPLSHYCRATPSERDLTY